MVASSGASAKGYAKNVRVGQTMVFQSCGGKSTDGRSSYKSDRSRVIASQTCLGFNALV